MKKARTGGEGRKGRRGHQKPAPEVSRRVIQRETVIPRRLRGPYPAGGEQLAREVGVEDREVKMKVVLQPNMGHTLPHLSCNHSGVWWPGW